MSDFQQPPTTPAGGIATQPQSTWNAPHTEGESAVSQASPSEGTTQPITKRQEVSRVAAQMFSQSPDWVTFFRVVLGVEGVARRIFNSPEDMEAFEQTEEYSEIQQMLAQLRGRSRSQAESNEPTRVITVRMPKSLHESLKAESHQRRTSMNQLCISKLLQIIDTSLVPSD